MKTEKWTCDIKGCKNEASLKSKNIQVIFVTEQNEGRSCTLYLSNEKIDICTGCLNHILRGNYIRAFGAQGYNEYRLNTRYDETN